MKRGFTYSEPVAYPAFFLSTAWDIKLTNPYDCMNYRKDYHNISIFAQLFRCEIGYFDLEIIQ